MKVIQINSHMVSLKYGLLVSILTLSHTRVFGQNTLFGGTVQDREYFMTLSSKTEDTSKKLGARIRGSMYFDEGYIVGKVFYKDELKGNYLIRYNAYSDDIEIEKSSYEVGALHKNSDISCLIGDQHFYYVPYITDGQDIGIGYMIKIVRG